MEVWQGRPGRVKASRITGKSAGQEKGGMLEGKKGKTLQKGKKNVQKLEANTIQRQMHHIKCERTGNYT